MNVIDKVIGYFDPKSGLKRASCRKALRHFEAARPGKDFNPKRFRFHQDEAISVAGASIREQARYMEANYDLASGALNILVMNVIGKGIHIEPQIKDPNGSLLPKVNQPLLQAFEQWCKRPEVTRELSWVHVQQLAARSWFRDGEYFTQLIHGSSNNIRHATNIPFSIELLEADRVPLDYDDAKRNIIQGIEKNEWGQPMAYYVFKHHPSGHLLVQHRDTKRVKAERILHTKLMHRIGQTRGMSVFASVLKRLYDIAEYESSEQLAARISAAMVGYIKRDRSMENYNVEEDERVFDLEKGSIFDALLPGEDVGTIESTRPNTQLENFRNAQLRALAAGTGTGFSSIAKNYNGTYSAQRQELVEQYIYYQALRCLFIDHFIQPIWERFVDVFMLSNPLSMQHIDRNSLYQADFRGQPMPWIDPKKEIDYEEKATKAGFKSRTQVIRDRGGNPEIVHNQIRQERKQAASDGLKFSSNLADEKEAKSKESNKKSTSHDDIDEE